MKQQFFAAFFVLAYGLPAQAQTLGLALEQAWARHPQASALSAREDEAQARAELAQGLTPGPAALSLSSLNDRLNRNRGRQEWEAEVAVPLWLPGQQAARQAEADSGLIEMTARRAALRLQLAGGVREAWWRVAAARNAEELAQRRVTTARSLDADVQRRHKAGDLSRIDANLAQGERLSAENEIVESHSARQSAEQAWRQLTGLPAPAMMVEEAPARIDEPAEDHPQRAAAAAATRVAQERLRLAEETRRDAPSLALRMVRDRDNFSESYSHAVGVKLTIPFSSGPRVRQDTAAARAETLQADAELAQINDRLQRDVGQARLDVDAAKRQLSMARERNALAADSLRLAEKAFALGEIDLSTLLRMRAGAYEAESFFNRQQLAQGLAQSRLNQALGVLP